MEKKFTGDIVLEAIHSKGMGEVRKIVYGGDVYQSHEAIAMGMFIDSRMDAVRSEIIAQLKN